jgi:hypothetical protein
MWSKFLKAFHRKPAAPSAAEIRRQLSELRHRHAQKSADRDALAHDSILSERIAEQYVELDEEASELERGMRLLKAALPAADAKEAEAARQAEAAALARRIEEFDRNEAEARGFVDTILVRLVTGEELTVCRELGRVQSREGQALHALTGDARHRRPIDPMFEIRAALVHRIERIDRARWAPQAPITLTRKEKSA